MYTNNAYRNYVEDEVTEADPLRLVVLLYRGALDAVAAARLSLRNGDIAARSAQVSKAVAIVNELALKLDHGKGGDLSRNLAELYDYAARRLNEANFQQSDEPLAEVQQLLGTLVEAWQACESVRTPAAAPGATLAPEEYRPLSCTA